MGCPHVAPNHPMCLACVERLSTERRRSKRAHHALEAERVRQSTLDYEQRLRETGGARSIAYGLRRETLPGALRSEGPWVDLFGHARDTDELCFDEER